MKRILLLLPLLILFACNNQITEEDVVAETKRIHDKVLTIDSHMDTPLWMTREGFDIGIDNSEGARGSKVDLARMEKGGLDAAFFAVFVGQGSRDEAGNARAYERAMILFDTLYAAIGRYPDKAEIATSSMDAYRLEKEGKRAIFIGLENGYPIGNDIKKVQEFYDLGTRYITLCHSVHNDICSSSSDKTTPEVAGLSEFGKEVVKEMNRLGIIVDVSHASDESFYNVLEVSETPVIASHSCARSICNSHRNLDDKMLKALAENGGVIQMCILSSYVEEPAPNPERDSAMDTLRSKYNNWQDLTDEQLKSARAEWQQLNVEFPRILSTVEKVVDHIDHIVAVAGIDHVGIGTDFDGGGGVEGCYDVSEMGNITLELVKRGYTEEEIEKIWGKNFMRVFMEVEEYARNNKQGITNMEQGSGS